MVGGVHLRHNMKTSPLILSDELGALPLRSLGEDAHGGWWGGEWMDYMARFEWLVELAHEGKLLRQQLRTYQRLLRLLHEHYPLTLQLDLPIPEPVRREAERLVGRPVDRAA